MLRLALAQMRRSRGRLAASGIAVAIGCAFVAVTLLAGDVLTRTTYASITAEYADADLVVTGPSGLLTDDDVAELSAVPGVEALHPERTVWVTVRGAEGELVVAAQSPATDDRLEAQVLVDGRMPGPGEITLTDRAAASAGAEIGDTVTVVSDQPLEDDGSALTARLRVVGVLDGFTLSPTGGVATVLVGAEDLALWSGPATDPHGSLDAVLLALDDGASLAQVQDLVAGVVADHFTPGLYVATPDELAEQTIQLITAESRALTIVALAFAAVALLVAALVIGNTFQVLVAQRTRTLALLRCVGADRAQVRRSVIVEAAILGTLASTAGMVIGTGVVQVILVVLGRTAPGVPLPDGAPVSLASVAVPILVGVAVTVVAALAPARAATRVAPVAALRPADAPRVSDRAGKVRAAVAAALVVTGAGLMGLAVAASGAEGRAGFGLALAVAVLGGAVSFIGILLSAVFWVPRLVGLCASALRPAGIAARLAGSNVTRNPRRVSATSTALLIGVTLVVMMATGATGAKTAIARELDTQFPVDVAVSAPFGDRVPEQVVEATRAVPGVTDAVTLSGATVTLGVRGMMSEGHSVLAPSEDAIAALRVPSHIDGLRDDTVVVPRVLLRVYDLDAGDELQLWLPALHHDDQDVGVVTLQVVPSDLPGDTLMITPATMERLGASLPESWGAPTENTVWVEVDSRDAVTAVSRIEAEAARSDTPLMVAGLAAIRESYEEVVDTVLAVVVGLLAVSVLIALIGVANTLSLSVLERRRESATLRAIGLTRDRLRASLAVEGMLIAVVGAVAGSVLGTAYGWVGTRVVLEQMGPVGLVVAWRDVGLAVLVAAGAGVLASVLPGRRAARSSPVTALADE